MFQIHLRPSLHFLLRSSYHFICSCLWRSLQLNFQEAFSRYRQRTMLLYLWRHISVVSVTSNHRSLRYHISDCVYCNKISFQYVTLYVLHNWICHTRPWSNTVLPPSGVFRKFRWYWRSLLDGRHVHLLYYWYCAVDIVPSHGWASRRK